MPCEPIPERLSRHCRLPLAAHTLVRMKVRRRVNRYWLGANMVNFAFAVCGTLSLLPLTKTGKPPALPEDSTRFDLCHGRRMRRKLVPTPRSGGEFGPGSPGSGPPGRLATGLGHGGGNIHRSRDAPACPLPRFPPCAVRTREGVAASRPRRLTVLGQPLRRSPNKPRALPEVI